MNAPSVRAEEPPCFSAAVSKRGTGDVGKRGGVDVVATRTFPVAELAHSCARVPAAAGVYVFRGPEGQAFYVGKSSNLRARLGSYFQPAAARHRKTRSLQRFADTVDVERTGSEFAALLREVELVQALAPPYNRRLRRHERYTYIGIDYRDPFPRLTVTDTPWEGGQFLGPFANTGRTREAVDVVADLFTLRTCDGAIEPDPSGAACWRHQVRTCSAPCLGATSPGTYGRDLLQALQACTGRSRAVLTALVAQRDRLAAAERFEEAARQQRRLVALERLRRILFVTQRVWHDAVVVQPATEPGTVRLWGIAAGSVCSEATCAAAQIDAGATRVWQAVEHAATERLPLVPQHDLDARWIVHRWLTSPTGRRWSVRLGRNSAVATRQQIAALGQAAVADLFSSAATGR